MKRAQCRSWLIAMTIAAILVAEPVLAVMDIEDDGPLLQAGRFALRVSNIGVLGNPWFDSGRSFDPSFESPRGSGHELLGRAELWVAATRPDGSSSVSGGPMYEWRPTLSPTDRVREVMVGAPGSRWNVDDDLDGRVDEDPLNGKDDDGDALVDEDFDLPSQQMLSARYTDTQPEAVEFGYANGERHVPLGLAVHQEVYGWSSPDAKEIAGVRFVVTNVGSTTLTDLRLGLYVDLDSRHISDRGGHLDDRIHNVQYEMIVPEGEVVLFARGAFRKQCFTRIEGQAVAVMDSRDASLPVGAIVPLSHTSDPLAFLTNDAFPGVREARAAARATTSDHSFRTSLFAQGLPPGQGGPPVLDEQRLAALSGQFRGVDEDGFARDHAVLVSCGPFAYLLPGTSLEFSVALVASTDLDSIPAAARRARMLDRGMRFNSTQDVDAQIWFEGESGINGHEICYEPPPGIEFNYDPHCGSKFFGDPLLRPDPNSEGPPIAFEVEYRSGGCIWSDLDCDACTGKDGWDLTHRWSTSSLVPSPPESRVTPGDGEVLIEWDDSPEVALASGAVGDASLTFEGYKLYRLDDWQRVSRLPQSEQWQRVAVFRADTSRAGGLPLSAITDSSVSPIGQVSGVPLHPVGRYRVTDRGLHVGADYHYVVTSIVRIHSPRDTLPSIVAELESPFIPEFSERVSPQTAARGGRLQVWVVPNPYRGRADWERPPVPGDPFTRHLDFLGLPRERSTIRIYTLAGDHVASIHHDGRTGDGQASWDLISRNGQDVASGIYLFTVDSPAGHQTGRFVILR